MKTEILKSISPRSSDYTEKFSFNLSRWLKKNKRWSRFSNVFFAPEPSHPTWSEDQTCPPALYVGFLDDGYLCGTRLSEILTMGAKAKTWAFPPAQFEQKPVEITGAFWPRYLALGKCALDPQHTLYYGRDRYDVKDDTRICRWCGRVEHRIERVESKAVSVWVPVGPTEQ